MSSKQQNGSTFEPTTDIITPDDPLWEAIQDISFLGYRTSHHLRDHGFETVGDVWEADLSELTEVPRIGCERACAMKVQLGDLTGIPAVGPVKRERLNQAGITGQNAGQFTVEQLSSLPQITEEVAEQIIYYSAGPSTDGMGNPALEEDEDGLEQLVEQMTQEDQPDDRVTEESPSQLFSDD